MTKFCFDDGKNLFETYDKDETDALLLDKANAQDVYTKAESDAEFETKRDAQAVRRNLLALIDEKADQDGTYNGLTAGYAKQVVSNIRVTDKTPYLFRTSGGSLDIGNREFPTIIGGTVAFNQLVQNGNFETVSNWSTWGDFSFAVNNGVGVLTVTNTIESQWNCLFQNKSLVVGHKYFMSCDVKSKYAGALCGITNSNRASTPTTAANIWQNLASLFSATGTSNDVQINVGVNYSNYAVGDTIEIKNVFVIDLTQLFGATIADYIYSLESATAGSGVAFCRAYSPEIFSRYNAYNAGELISVQAFQHITTGFNAWDEETELGFIDVDTGALVTRTDTIRSKNFCRLASGLNYCLTYIGHAEFAPILFLYDIDFNYLDYYSFPLAGSEPRVINVDNAAYFKTAFPVVYGTTYNNDICINISWDGERDGQYEPYIKNVYDLAENLELRGIPKLDAAGGIYYDGDVYEHTGDVTRKYGIVDLGTLTWNYATNESYPYFYANLIGKKLGRNIGMLCPNYLHNSGYRSDVIANNKSIGTFNDSDITIVIRDDSYNDAAAFKTAMSGVYLVYELATPTTETVDGFEYPQIVDDFGTEFYFDYREIPLPVGHVTEYDVNLRAKLEMAPNSPDADGLYLMQHNNGINEYMPYISPIPALPTTNGTYVLKCVVSGGVPALSWVLEE